ncbi:MAG TPA: TlpA disulfide reductase family protein [Gemmataceae bacterium]|jgi:thiol-disulfide isomerase/thioredoxin|nr:TlpA disulfide reductase family protein [Gemmataceae bacterium]
MRVVCTGFAALSLLVVAAGPPAKDGKVTVTVVKYDGLTEVVKKNKGKVLVLDFWADYCIPCKREFPKLVALNQRHAKDPFLAISVSLDDLSEDETKAKVQKFLDAQKATFTNLILDEKPEVWQSKLKIDGPPLVIVFNKDGGLEQKFVDKAVDYEKIGQLVAELLKK